jgi:hypothetical protein
MSGVDANVKSGARIGVAVKWRPHPYGMAIYAFLIVRICRAGAMAIGVLLGITVNWLGGG